MTTEISVMYGSEKVKIWSGTKFSKYTPTHTWLNTGYIWSRRSRLYSFIIFLARYISAFKHNNVKTWHQSARCSESLTFILPNLNNFYPLKIVNRVSETQPQEGWKSNLLIWRLEGWQSQKNFQNISFNAGMGSEILTTSWSHPITRIRTRCQREKYTSCRQDHFLGDVCTLLIWRVDWKWFNRNNIDVKSRLLSEYWSENAC